MNTNHHFFKGDLEHPSSTSRKEQVAQDSGSSQPDMDKDPKSEATVWLAKNLRDFHKNLTEELGSKRTIANNNNSMEHQEVSLLRRIQQEISTIKRGNEERVFPGYPELRSFFQSMIIDEMSAQDSNSNCSERI